MTTKEVPQMIGARISMGFANFFSTDSFMGCLLSLAMVRWYILRGGRWSLCRN